jgi:hypothetical protein
VTSNATGNELRSIALLKPAIVVSAAALFAMLVLSHTPGLNGPWYWLWRWRADIPTARWYLALLAAAVPFFAALALPRLAAAASRRAVTLALTLFMLSTFALRIASSTSVRGWFDTTLITDAVKSPQVTSYYFDASMLLSKTDRLAQYEPGWLARYPDFLPLTSLHTQSKPPGPMLYWVTLIRLFGDHDRTALVGAMLLGLLATVSIPMTYLMVRQLTQQPRAALLAAAWVSLAPGFVLFFPMFDPTYLVFSCAMVMLWHRAVARRSYHWAAAFGLVVGVATFWTYLVLVLVPFLLLLGLLCTQHKPAIALPISIRLAAPALGAFIGFYLALWIVAGFNPVATFSQAWENQGRFLARHEAARAYPMTVVYDLLDFMLGAGWIGAILVAFALARKHQRALMLLCVAQPVFVAFTGLVQTETARVWMFMLPLWTIPIGLELGSWPHRWFVLAYLGLWLLTAAIGQNMIFISPETAASLH